MRCNGCRCDEAARPPMCFRANGVKEANASTKATTTPAGDGNDITKASGTPAGDGTDITKASGTPAGDGTDITKASGTPAGDGNDITKASGTPAGDGSAPTLASGDRVDGVEEAGVVVTPASKCEVSAVREPSGVAPDYTNQTLRRREAKKPKLSARDRGAATPETPGAPYTWADAFVDFTAIFVVVASGVLAYYTCW